MWRMSSDVIPSGGFSIYFFAQHLDIWFYSKLPPLRGLYHNGAMQRNAFHEIWTLLSHIFLRGIRAYGCNRVRGTPFYNREVMYSLLFYE